jgi:hypothetical protein
MGTMKLLLFFFFTLNLTTSVFGQGLINFFNNATTLYSVGNLVGLPTPPPSANSYYFALLTSPVGANTFTFSGVYATNQLVIGRFTGGANIQVDGWAPGVSRDFKVVGWSAGLGPTFDPTWLINPGPTTPNQFFGMSALGTGQAGGFNGTGTLPNLNIFGGAGGIQAGFALLPTAAIPEPSSVALATFGLVTVLVARFRKSSASNVECSPSPQPSPREKEANVFIVN